MVLMPRPQVRFLQCLDDIRVPHKPPKQLWSALLPITGVQVDCDNMQYTMSEESRLLLIQAIEEFFYLPDHILSAHCCRALRHCQALSEHVNWVFSVFPQLRPSLSSLYMKMGSSYQPQKTGKKSFLVAISDFSNELLTKPNLKRRDCVWIIPFGK